MRNVGIMDLFGFVLFLFGEMLGEKHHQDSYASTLTYCILIPEFFCRALFSSCACAAAIRANQTQSAEGVNCFVLTIVLLTAVFYNRFLRSALSHTMHV